jgi:hypothetical protein
MMGGVGVGTLTNNHLRLALGSFNLQLSIEDPDRVGTGNLPRFTDHGHGTFNCITLAGL